MSSVNQFLSSQRPGLYVHIPFCQSKCGYCDFYSITDQSWQTNFIHSLCDELKFYQNEAKNYTFDTIYFGGGTPSVLKINELSRVIETINRNYSIADNSEITIEINPGTVDYDQLKSYRQMGFTRLSIGVQSFNDDELRILQREHTSDDNYKTIKYARRSGFENISIDLIYALPRQTKDVWSKTLNQAVVLQPEHISTYNLTIEEGTPFYDLLRSGQISLPSNDKEANLFSLTGEILSKGGFQRYEISNFARSADFISHHNAKYWDHTPYLGFGPFAHSFWNNKRYSNIRSVGDYINKLNHSIAPVAQSEVLSLQTLMFESIFLGLRTREGVNLRTFHKRYNKDFTDLYAKPIQILTSKRLAFIKDQQFQLTQKGLLLSDEILPLFLPN